MQRTARSIEAWRSNPIDPERVPRFTVVVVSLFLAFCRINNLRLFSPVFVSIPNAPTNYLSNRWTFNKSTREGQEGARLS